MFTGIIAGLGKIGICQRNPSERRFQILPQFEMRDIIDGESISVNGVCLSVEAHENQQFRVYASAETLSRSTLGSLVTGDCVNLERALKAGERMGGHIVSGHIDCVATVSRIEKRSQSLAIRVGFPAHFSPLVVSKGSICLDGISLTVNNCGNAWLEVNIIPDSQRRTNISQWRQGTSLNMETDIIGKYVRHMLRPWEGQARSGLDIDFLASNGFL